MFVLKYLHAVVVAKLTVFQTRPRVDTVTRRQPSLHAASDASAPVPGRTSGAGIGLLPQMPEAGNRGPWHGVDAVDRQPVPTARRRRDTLSYINSTWPSDLQRSIARKQGGNTSTNETKDAR